MAMSSGAPRADTGVADRLRRAMERASALAAPRTQEVQRLVPALQRRLEKRLQGVAASTWALGAREAKRDPLEYMQLCRKYLAKLDTLGWNRSYHQRLFHDDFLKACTRSFWKLEPPGQFARDHQKVLRVNSWDHIAQEILISTPRRFGKTISVSMFCAAMLLACPGVEISIYSTCKRISQKILRNVQKFAMLIADSDYATLNFSVKRENMEEINLQGPLGNTDIRIINSYPSKVRVCQVYCVKCKSPTVQKSKSPTVQQSNSPKVQRPPKVQRAPLVGLQRLRHEHQLALGQRQGLGGIFHRHQSKHVLQQLRQPLRAVLGLGHEVLQEEEEVARFAAHVEQRERRVCALLHVDQRPAQVDLEQRDALFVHLPAQLAQDGALRVRTRHSCSRCSQYQTTGTSCMASNTHTAAILLRIAERCCRRAARSHCSRSTSISGSSCTENQAHTSAMGTSALNDSAGRQTGSMVSGDF